MNNQEYLQKLLMACEDFVARNVWLSDPEEAAGACEDMCQKFLDENSELGGKMLYLTGYRTHRPNRAEYWEEHENPDHWLYHVMCLFPGEVCVCLTSRQLDSKGPVYQVHTLAAVKDEWLVLTSSIDVMENLWGMSGLFQQTDVEYLRSVYQDTATEDWLKKKAENQSILARECYEKFLRHLKDGHIVLTQLEGNNAYSPILDAMSAKFGIAA